MFIQSEPSVNCGSVGECYRLMANHSLGRVLIKHALNMYRIIGRNKKIHQWNWHVPRPGVRKKVLNSVSSESIWPQACDSSWLQASVQNPLNRKTSSAISTPPHPMMCFCARM
jgi:hypothetical protein